MSSTQPQERSTLADQALIALEELIVTAELKPGSVWSEAQLCEQVNIGRTPVREALQRLQSEHLVEVIPRFGIKIAEHNVEDQLLLLEVRRELERLIAVSAAKRSSAGEREQCAEIANTLIKMASGDVLEFLRYHDQVKRFITRLARNPYAARAIMPYHAISRRFYYLHHLRTNDMPLAGEHHAAVVRAIAAGDPVQAASASDRLMDYAVAITRAAILEQPTSLY